MLYLGNWLIRGQFQDETKAALDFFFYLFSQLGLLVNQEVVSCTTQTVKFIGAWLNSSLAKGLLPEDQFQSLQFSSIQLVEKIDDNCMYVSGAPRPWQYDHMYICDAA